MDQDNNIQALFILVNAGYADDAVEIARNAGARGATILNARGEGAYHEVFMGITVDSEKEIILTINRKNVAEAVMEAIREQAGIETPFHGICFTMDVSKVAGLDIPDE